MRSLPEFESRCRAELSARALVNNFHAVHGQVPTQAVIAMIKANAYGHGAAWAARQLSGLNALFAMGVATLEEGAEVRQALKNSQQRSRILVFSGAAPWTEEKGRYCEHHGLTPVIYSEPDWITFYKGGWPERLTYHLKFNTGMNRLGIPGGYASQIVRALKTKTSAWQPEGVCSHLAQGELPDSKISRLQLERFIALRAELSEAMPSAQFHLANSAAIWNAKHWGLSGLTDIVRPGLSLYGVPPWKGAVRRGLEPVMTLEAQVLSVNRLKRGESVGYGATYIAKGGSGGESETIAILGAGYADGLQRTLGQKGSVFLGGRHEPLLGRVSMDLSATSCAQSVRAGDYAELMGPHIDIWEQAEAAGTIPYELLTSVSGRVQKKYE